MLTAQTHAGAAIVCFRAASEAGGSPRCSPGPDGPVPRELGPLGPLRALGPKEGKDSELLRKLPRLLEAPLAPISCWPWPLISASARICSRDPEVLPSEPRLSEPDLDPPLLYPPCRNPHHCSWTAHNSRPACNFP